MNKKWIAASPVAIVICLSFWITHERPQRGQAHLVQGAQTSPWGLYQSGSDTSKSPKPQEQQAQQAPPRHVNMRFTATNQGNLVVNEQARNDIERLVALETRDEAQTRLKELGQHLAPAAQKQLADLLFKYAQYADALRQSFSPDDLPESTQDVLAQFNLLHATRERHFGAETAKALFGPEEASTAELIELMQARALKEPSLTLEQTVELAQADLSKLHKP